MTMKLNYLVYQSLQKLIPLENPIQTTLQIKEITSSKLTIAKQNSP